MKPAERNILTPYTFIRSNISNHQKQIPINVLCLSVCVFLQTFFFGISAGLKEEVSRQPGGFGNVVNFYNAVSSWTWILFGIITFIIIVTLITQIMTDLTERRKEIGVFRAIGFTRKNLIYLLMAEYLITGIFAFMIGSIFSILCGIFVDVSFNGEIGVFASPFAVTPWMLAPLLTIIVSIYAICYVTLNYAWHRPLHEVLRYE